MQSTKMFLEIAIVILLTLINGLFAMSELAIVSARPARLKLMAKKGNKSAGIALQLAADPSRFLSSVQIGITLVGILNGAVSGATLGSRLSAILIQHGVPATLADPIGVGTVVVLITYISLIVGELVPKQIALKAPERVAARVAPMMRVVAQVASPLIWVLDWSGRAVLHLLGQSAAKVHKVSDEEVRLIIAEAESTGAMEPAESQMIAGVMRVADRAARGLMTPRHEVEMIDVNCSHLELLERLNISGRSRLPVWEGQKDNVIGVLMARDMLAPNMMTEPFGLRTLLCDAPVVREEEPATEVIDRLRSTPSHMLLVYDDNAHFQGVITPMDILQAITGDFPDSERDEPKVVTKADGSYLIAGWMPVDEFADLLTLSINEDRDYDTAAGFVLDQIGRLPHVGERLELPKWSIEVVDLDGRRIDKLLVAKRG